MLLSGCSENPRVRIVRTKNKCHCERKGRRPFSASRNAFWKNHATGHGRTLWKSCILSYNIDWKTYSSKISNISFIDPMHIISYQIFSWTVIIASWCLDLGVRRFPLSRDVSTEKCVTVKSIQREYITAPKRIFMHHTAEPGNVIRGKRLDLDLKGSKVVDPKGPFSRTCLCSWGATPLFEAASSQILPCLTYILASAAAITRRIESVFRLFSTFVYDFSFLSKRPTELTYKRAITQRSRGTCCDTF